MYRDPRGCAAVREGPGPVPRGPPSHFRGARTQPRKGLSGRLGRAGRMRQRGLCTPLELRWLGVGTVSTLRTSQGWREAGSVGGRRAPPQLERVLLAPRVLLV